MAGQLITARRAVVIQLEHAAAGDNYYKKIAIAPWFWTAHCVTVIERGGDCDMRSTNIDRVIGAIGTIAMLLFITWYACGGKDIVTQQDMQTLDAVISNM